MWDNMKFVVFYDNNKIYAKLMQKNDTFIVISYPEWKILQEHAELIITTSLISNDVSTLTLSQSTKIEVARRRTGQYVIFHQNIETKSGRMLQNFVNLRPHQSFELCDYIPLISTIFKKKRRLTAFLRSTSC